MNLASDSELVRARVGAQMESIIGLSTGGQSQPRRLSLTQTSVRRWSNETELKRKLSIHLISQTRLDYLFSPSWTKKKTREIEYLPASSL